MPVCVLCGEGSFDELDGQYFCNICGTQSQVSRCDYVFSCPLYARMPEKMFTKQSETI